MSEKVSTGSAGQPLAHEHARDFDWLSTFSFIGASVLGVGTLLSNIRHRFFNVFIEGYNETRTPFSDIIKEYRGDKSMDGRGGKFLPHVEAFNSGDIDASEYAKRMRGTASEFREAVHDKLLRDFDIPSKGLKGWTLGTLKRWKELGMVAKRDTTIGFATVAAIGVGAIAVLRHSKDTIDRIEDKIDDAQSRGR